jgi:cell division cycle protein 37
MKKAVTEAEKNLAERDAAKSKAEEVPLGPDAPPPPPPASAAAASTSSALAASAQGPVDERHVMLGCVGSSRPPSPLPPPHPPHSLSPRYGEFCELYEEQMEHFLSIPNMEGARDYLHKNGDILLAEHAQSYILLSCLENEMNGNTAKAELECRHSQVLSHVCELATSMGKNPRDMVLPFFVRMQEEVHNRGFLEQVAGFVKRIKTRAIAKRKEMDAEAAANPEYVEMTEEERLGPGGLDPVQVMETLPQSMQDAFQARDIPALQAALDAMPADEASKHMKRCIDSGLWSA